MFSVLQYFRFYLNIPIGTEVGGVRPPAVLGVCGVCGDETGTNHTLSLDTPQLEYQGPS